MNLDQLKTAFSPVLQNRTDICIEFTTTQKCNCHCDYCFECGEQYDMNIDIQNKCIDLLVEYCQNFDVLKHRYLVISFWGGEPFLNTQFILKVINATFKYEFVEYHSYSNGTQMTNYKTLIDLLKSKNILNRFQIQLSYDGEPQHELKRHYTSKHVIESAKFLINSGINVSFKATLTFDMIEHLPEIWNSYFELYQMFGDVVSYSPTLDLTSSDIKYLDKWNDVLINIAKKELQFFNQHNRHLMQYFDGDAKRICDINNSISINADGSIHICHGCFYEKNAKHFQLGNVIDITSLNEVISPNNVDLTHIPFECHTCSATYCAVCHIKQLDPINKLSDWTMCMPNNENRCQYFKTFGKIHRALNISKFRVNKKHGNLRNRMF